MLAGSDRAFVLDGCVAGLRGDGRGCLDWRPVSIETSVVASASGSARIRIGATDVIVGIKVGGRMANPSRQACAHAYPVQLHACFNPAASIVRTLSIAEPLARLQVEISTPAPERPEHGRLQFSVECSACAGPSLQVRGRVPA